MGLMNKVHKILYDYFLEADGQVVKIPRNEDRHKDRLLKKIKKEYPTFMHPYAFMAPPNPKETADAHAVITVFKEYGNSMWARFKRWYSRA